MHLSPQMNDIIDFFLLDQSSYQITKLKNLVLNWIRTHARRRQPNITSQTSYPPSQILIVLSPWYAFMS